MQRRRAGRGWRGRGGEARRSAHPPPHPSRRGGSEAPRPGMGRGTPEARGARRSPRRFGRAGRAAGASRDRRRGRRRSGWGRRRSVPAPGLPRGRPQGRRRPRRRGSRAAPRRRRTPRPPARTPPRRRSPPTCPTAPPTAPPREPGRPGPAPATDSGQAPLPGACRDGRRTLRRRGRPRPAPGGAGQRGERYGFIKPAGTSNPERETGDQKAGHHTNVCSYRKAEGSRDNREKLKSYRRETQGVGRKYRD